MFPHCLDFAHRQQQSSVLILTKSVVLCGKCQIFCQRINKTVDHLWYFRSVSSAIKARVVYKDSLMTETISDHQTNPKASNDTEHFFSSE